MPKDLCKLIYYLTILNKILFEAEKTLSFQLLLSYLRIISTVLSYLSFETKLGLSYLFDYILNPEIPS